MNIYQSHCDGLKFGKRHGRVIGKRTRTSCRSYLSAQNTTVVVPLYIRRLTISLEFIITVDRKHCFNDTFARRVSDNPRVGPAAKNERQRTQYNGFAGTGFTCYYIESFVKSDVYTVNECVVGYVECFEHSLMRIEG